jgi:hypothetical protein
MHIKSTSTLEFKFLLAVLQPDDVQFSRQVLNWAIPTASSLHNPTMLKKEVKWSCNMPWGESRYSSYSFLTSALDGGEWSASRPGCALPLEKGSLVPTVQETGWAPEPVWTQRVEEKSSASVGVQTPVVQSIVRHYTDWAIPAPIPQCTSL